MAYGDSILYTFLYYDYPRNGRKKGDDFCVTYKS